MQYTFTVQCPECGENDTTTVEVEDVGISFFVTQCGECNNPYAIELEASITTIPCIIRRK